ncbi:MAG: hypothetical protein M3Y59_10435 [Myxococcota bacterium]|nr:hypothetical protein [Myxococcota bacterium]
MRGLIFGVGAVGAVLWSAACTPETQCEYFDEPAAQRTGDIAQDIQRCWQGIGSANLGQDPAYLLVYDFSPLVEGDPTPLWREVQSANRLYPSGQIFEYGYGVVQAADPDAGTPAVLDLGPDLPQARAEVTDTSLILNWVFEEGVLPQVLRRGQCTGFGFEEPEFTCPAPPVTQARRRGPLAD